MGEDTIRVLLIDDHPLTRRGLASCLTDTGRCSIAGEACSLGDAWELIEALGALPAYPAKFPGPQPGKLPVEVVILDIALGDENGLEFIGYLKKFCEFRNFVMPAVLICSMYEDPFRIRSAIEMGAMGYVPKTANEGDFLEAIDTVMRGEVFIEPRLEIKINEQPDAYAIFTRREREVLALVKKNYDNQRIARALSLGLHTVENHISRIYCKTGLTGREELRNL